MRITVETECDDVSPDDIFDALEEAGFYVASVTVNGQKLTNGDDF